MLSVRMCPCSSYDSSHRGQDGQNPEEGSQETCVGGNPREAAGG